MSAAAAVIAHLQGGLGNQLFCYAAARALSLRTGVPLRINTIAGFHNEKYKRSCQVRFFNIDAPEAGWWEGFHDPLGRSRRSWSRRINDKKPIEQRRLIQEPRDQRFVPELISLKPMRSVYLVGYWQDERYFDDAAGVLRNDLQLRAGSPFKPDAMIDELTRQPDCVSVHCRSYGEVANPAAGLQLGVDYYTRAFRAVLNKAPGASFVVFSDNPAWARQMIEQTGFGDRTRFAPPTDADATTATLTDYCLMSRCRHHVVANSSFSWWTAWLGEREGSVVVAPPGGLPGNGRFPQRWTEHA